MQKSTNQFIDYVKSFETYFENSDHLLSILSTSSMVNIKEVNAFFQADKFKGYVVQVEFNESNLVYEAYLTQAKNNYLIDTSTNYKHNLLLKSIIKLEISSDYDAKERRFNNYGSILDLNSNPSVLIWLDPIDEPLRFKIVWIDPDGKCLNIENRVDVSISEKGKL